MTRTFESIKLEILDLIKANPNITPKEIGTELKLSHTYTYKMLYIMFDNHEIDMDVKTFETKDELHDKISILVKHFVPEISDKEVEDIYNIVFKKLNKLR